MNTGNYSLTCEYILNSLSVCHLCRVFELGISVSGGFTVSRASLAASGWAWHRAPCQTQVLFVVSATH